MSRAMLQPGQTIGIVGGGQLGRMAVREARRSGYRTVVFTDESPGCPAGQLADAEINASYYDEAARDRFVRAADVVTVEFENIPAAFLSGIENDIPVYPPRRALETCQNREREKNFLKAQGIPHAPFRVVDGPGAVAAALAELGGDAVLKTADFGYDGKGQQKLTTAHDPARAWQELGAPRGVLEQRIDFAMEISVVCARARDGALVQYPAAENIHARHILDMTISPARLAPPLAAEAAEIAATIAGALEYTGTMAVEMFVTRDGRLVVNEIAPRPHNSGHHTIESCVTNQFQQQVRTVAGMPPGEPRQHTAAVMVNLIGDLWPAPERAPDFSAVLRHPAAFLHLYGKRHAKAGRKMGHFTVLAESADAAVAEAMRLRAALGIP